MKNIIVVTGGAGYVGSNLIRHFISNTNYKIISIDNYSSGSKNNHIKNAKVNYIKENIQVFNEEPINGNISIPNTEELKRRYTGAFGAQDRAVTKEDYVSMVYTMPPVYGSIKRAAVIRDTNDLRRNLNIFLMAPFSDGPYFLFFNSR